MKDTELWILQQLQKKNIAEAIIKSFSSWHYIGGKLPLEGTKRTQIFHLPGPVHHARWMAKAIYCLKIFLFREHFKLTAREFNGIREVCVFIIRHYLKLWFNCVSAVGAPLQDLSFVQTLLSPSTHSPDTKMKKLLLKKMSNHLWYLLEEAVGLSLFDKNVSDEVKQKMAQLLLEYSAAGQEEDEGEEEDDYEPAKRFIISVENISNLNDKDLSYFVTRKTLNFFKRFDISLNFLRLDPKIWKTNKAYSEALIFLNQIPSNI